MSVEDLEKAVGVVFKDRGLLEQAMCHRSAAEEGLAAAHNERLEYLGDAVLQLTITSALYERFPQASEGDLSRIRARLVNKEFLAGLAGELALGELLVLGKGEERDGRTKPSLLADAFEAMLGALFLDAGFPACQSVVSERFAQALDRIEDPTAFGKHPKSALQELCMRRWRQTPDYDLLETTGPAHQRSFVYGVSLGERELARGVGGSKQIAQAQAAELALRVLEEEED